MLLLATTACAFALHGGARLTMRLRGGDAQAEAQTYRFLTMRLRGGDVAEPQTFRFPDGSMYRGGVQDGMQHGDGEWRSAEGDVYKGSFARGAFEGAGKYTDARGNVYEGGFVGGAFQGPSSYAYVDGRAEVGAYEGGQEIGEGARWSPDRARAWRLRDGQVDGEITLEDAAAIAAALGLAIPDGIFAPPPEALARLRERIGEDGAEAFAFDGHVAVPAHETVMRAGTLVGHSRQPLVDSATCDHIVAECEAIAAARGGWTTARHASHPTTDVPVQQLPQTLRWLRERLLPEIAWPFIAHAFDFALRDGGGDARDAIRVSEAFVVKYNASSGQRELRPHRDGCVLSFNIALNDLDEYEGGGTYFRALDDGGSDASALRSPKGHLLCHSSALMHGGHPISSGVRYILVAFCTIDPAFMPWAARWYEYVQGVIDSGEEEGQPEYRSKD